MEIRYVEWVDSAGVNNWRSVRELKRHGISRCQTVGFVLDETDEFVTFLQSLDSAQLEDEEDNGNNSISIPKCAITRSETLCQVS